MAFEQHMQVIQAGQQFDGTPNKGQFFKGGGEDRTGTKIVRVTMKMGSEAKDVVISIVSEDGVEMRVYEKLATVDEDLLILGVIALDVTEWLKIVTVNATSAMRAVVIEEDLKG